MNKPVGNPEKRTENPGRNRPPHKAMKKARRPVVRTPAMRKSEKWEAIPALGTPMMYSPEQKRRRFLRKK